MRTYTVSTYDCNDDPSKEGDWTVRASGVPLMRLRPILRELRGECRDNLTIAVDRDDFADPGRGGSP